MTKFIDVDKIIMDKSPKLAKWLPGFLVRYLKRILHQNEINQILLDNEGNNDYDFCVSILKSFNIKVQSIGLENIPESGGAIFVCNHPLGGMDALAIIQEVNKIRSDIKFVVNDILLNLKNLSGLFVGVNKHGTNTKDSLLELNNLFGSEQAVFVFPAGLVSRKKKKNIQDLEWKKTFVSRAKKYKRNVIPVYIDGELSNFFYRLSNLRQKLGVKANIEMLYLVNETFKQKNKNYVIKFGTPISFKTFDNSKSDKEWAASTKKIVYKLKD